MTVKELDKGLYLVQLEEYIQSPFGYVRSLVIANQAENHFNMDKNILQTKEVLKCIGAFELNEREDDDTATWGMRPGFFDIVNSEAIEAVEQYRFEIKHLPF